MRSTMDRDRLKHKIDRLRKRRAMLIMNDSSLSANGKTEKAFTEGLIYAYEEVYLDLLDYIEQRDGIDLNNDKRALDEYNRFDIKEENECIGVVSHVLTNCKLYEDPVSCGKIEMEDISMNEEPNWLYICSVTEQVCPRMEFRSKREWEKLKGECENVSERD